MLAFYGLHGEPDDVERGIGRLKIEYMGWKLAHIGKMGRGRQGISILDDKFRSEDVSSESI